MPLRILPPHYPTSGSSKIILSDLNLLQSYEPSTAYSQVMLATLLTVLEDARRWSGSGVTINAFNPGICNTELFRHYSDTQSFVFKLAIQPVLIYLFIFPQRAAQAGNNRNEV